LKDKVSLIKEEGVVKGFIVNDKAFYADNGRVEVEREDLKGFKISSIPDGFWLALIEENFISFYGVSSSLLRKDKYYGTADVEIPIYREYWDHRFGPDAYVHVMKEAIELRKKAVGDVDSVYVNHKEAQITLEYRIFFFHDLPIEEAYQKYQEIMKEIEGHTERILEGEEISVETLKDERKFALEVLLPLFRHMGFLDVKYNHGKREFGKDILFSEIDKFGVRRNYGVQAKSGDLSGEAGAKIDKIIAQIGDAFPMSYIDTASREERFISLLVIAISGRFSDNAKEKILKKVSQRGISFLDIDKIQELLARHMKKAIR